MSTTYYTADHEWLTIENTIVTVGITDHAQQALGEIVFVELPTIGETFTKGDGMAVVESVKAASDIYAPIDGEIVEVNSALDDSPEMVNAYAENDAWFIKIRINESTDLSSYMNRDDYLALIDLR